MIVYVLTSPPCGEGKLVEHVEWDVLIGREDDYGPGTNHTIASFLFIASVLSASPSVFIALIEFLVES